MNHATSVVLEKTRSEHDRAAPLVDGEGVVVEVTILPKARYHRKVVDRGWKLIVSTQVC